MYPPRPVAAPWAMQEQTNRARGGSIYECGWQWAGGGGAAIVQAATWILALSSAGTSPALGHNLRPFATNLIRTLLRGSA
jgi:hypothetical protein